MPWLRSASRYNFDARSSFSQLGFRLARSLPPDCPSPGPTYTPTETFTPTDTLTGTPTPTETSTPPDTFTPTDTPTPTCESSQLGWYETAMFTPSRNGSYGSTVSISGNVAVVGAPTEGTTSYNNVGAAYVYQYKMGVWTLEQKLTKSQRLANEYYGQSVACQGDWIAVGVPGWAYPSYGTGFVSFYKFNGSSWANVSDHTADPYTYDQLGASCAIDGNIILVGAPYGDRVEVLRKGTTSWVFQANLTSSDMVESNSFGNCVAINGNTAVIGAPKHDSYRGAAYVFAYQGGSWTEQAKLLPSDSATSDYFGQSVDISESVIAVGASHKASFHGAAYIFENADGNWVQVQKFTPDAGAYQYFGSSVALFRDFLSIGALGDGASYDGAVYVYLFDGNSWSRHSKYKTANTSYSSFGESLSVDNYVSLVGNSEAAHIFDGLCPYSLTNTPTETPIPTITPTPTNTSTNTPTPKECLVPSQYTTIQAAIDDAWHGDTVLIADGTYTGTGNRGISLNGKAITVRAAGSDPSLCIIDCELAGRGFTFSGTGETENSIVKGITIINGQAGNGGAVYCASSSPKFLNCIIRNNNASSVGGGVYLTASSAQFINCILYNNNGWSTGAFYCTTSGNPKLINCTIYGNQTSNYGAVRTYGSVFLYITNCIIRNNAKGQINVTMGISPYVYNSNVQGGWSSTGSNNIDVEPLFVDPSNGDFHLQSNSPCIDGGTSVTGVDADIDGEARPNPSTSLFDIGADEFY